jgi:hypothetical protein
MLCAVWQSRREIDFGWKNGQGSSYVVYPSLQLEIKR